MASYVDNRFRQAVMMNPAERTQQVSSSPLTSMSGSGSGFGLKRASVSGSERRAAVVPLTVSLPGGGSWWICSLTFDLHSQKISPQRSSIHRHVIPSPVHEFRFSFLHLEACADQVRARAAQTRVPRCSPITASSPSA